MEHRPPGGLLKRQVFPADGVYSIDVDVDRCTHVENVIIVFHRGKFRPP